MSEWRGIEVEARGTWSCTAADGEPCDWCVGDLRGLLRRAVAHGNRLVAEQLGCDSTDWRYRKIMNEADAIERGEVEV